MSRQRLVVLILVACGIAALYAADKISAMRVPVREALEMKYASFVKQRDFILKSTEAGNELRDALKELEDNEAYIIATSDTSLAFAKLQAKVQDLAQVAGMKLYAIKQLPPVGHKGYTGLPLFIDMRGDMQGLSEFLRYIDSTNEFIGIESLNVTSSAGGVLRVRMQLAGLMKS